MASRSLVICVPARDEADRLPRLLDALARQTHPHFIILIALNNTNDGSREAIALFCARNPDLRVFVDETSFAAPLAHAGSARRRAMDIAADLAGPEGLVLTTDADTRPPPDWIARNLAAMARGLDIAGGRIVIDESERLPDRIAALIRLADLYWVRVREIEDAINPLPWDLPPRHGDHTGASLCLTVSAYRRCGGVPAIRSGEDRALVQAVLRQGGKLAHPADIWTRVSPRLDGRATGGMADHIRRLQTDSLSNSAVMMPSFAQWRARAEWRREKLAEGGVALIAELEDGLPPMQDDVALDADMFGAVA